MSKSKPTLTLEEFLEEYNCAPWEMSKLAYVVVEKLDPKSSAEAKEFVKRAKAWLKADNAFRGAINKAGYEFG